MLASKIVLVIVAMVILSTPPSESSVMEGWATHYDEGVMQNTIIVQTELRHLPEEIDHDFYVGYIASPDCKRIGDIAYISHGGGHFKPYLVSDCAGANAIVEGGITWMERDNVLAEVDWATCVRWGTCGGGARIEMYYHPTLTSWDYPTKFREKPSGEQKGRDKSPDLTPQERRNIPI